MRFRTQGCSEAIDRLIGVAHNTDVARSIRQQQDKLVLHRVRVLVLVDQDVFEAALPGFEHIRVRLEQLHRDAEQVVEVHCTRSLEAALVFLEHLTDAALVRVVGAVEILGDRQALVLGCTDRAVHRSRRIALGVDVEIAQHIAGEPHRVGVVIDGER